MSPAATAPEPLIPRSIFGFSPMRQRVHSELSENVMHAYLDSGMYRHLSFVSPEPTRGHWCVITSSPDALTILGSMGAFTFTHRGDPFEMITSDVNTTLAQLARDVSAVDRHYGLREYDMETFGQAVLANVASGTRDRTDEDRRAIVADVLTRVVLTEEYGTQCEEGAREAIDMYDGHLGFQFDPDTKWDFESYSAAFEWSAHALILGVERYREAVRAAVPA